MNDSNGVLSEFFERISNISKETGITTEESIKTVNEIMNNLCDEDLIDFIDLIEINPNLSWWEKIKLKWNLKRYQNKKR